ncbi:MAG: SLATT domain-containing protein [Anaerolineales bacterium]|nr:SLATT domain-containing protein [Anaerolineales bacterium]
MDTQPQQPVPILEVAWTRFAQLDAISSKRTKAHLRMRRWIVALGILATLFAILSQSFPLESGLAGLIIRGLLLLLPILASGIAAYTSTNYANGDWLVSRAGAEEILKEIYSYRTILQDSPSRRTWLEKRLVEIQRSVYSGMNGELTMETYKGSIPPHHNPKDPSSDGGFNDINGDEYFHYRLEQQLNWHSERVVRRQAERRRLQTLILIAGGLGVFLAAVLPLWVALTAAFTAALIGWQELRNLDAVVRNYSKVRMELGILYDHWKSLDESEKTQSEFFNMVRSTEEILWSQNVEYIKAMQEALKASDLDEEASLINRVIKEARESDRRLKQSMEDAVVDFTSDKLGESEKVLTEEMENALNELSKEASSDIVRAELEAMQRGIQERFSGLKSALAEIAEEFAGVEIGSNTPPAVLNNLLSRYPKSHEPKG